MAPHTTALLALGLCLGQVIHTQEGALPRPSISAEPGSVIPRGRPVTIVCRGPAGVRFRLEKKGGSQHWDESNSSRSETEARFLFPSMSEDTAGHYHCLYLKSQWSERSEDLKLVLSREHTTQAPTRVPDQPPDTPALHVTTEHLYILIGVSLAFLLCVLVLLLLCCLHHQPQRKQGILSSKDQLQRPQDRLGLAVDSQERSPDGATADGFPEKDRDTGSSIPAAGDSQEVTYAQLDHLALTERAAQAVSPLTTESSTYAALARH